jgi:hypothetical protein
MSEVTRLLQQMGQGDRDSGAALLPLVYDELRRLARARMAQERAGHTLQAIALVHEAYLRLMNDGDGAIAVSIRAGTSSPRPPTPPPQRAQRRSNDEHLRDAQRQRMRRGAVSGQ